MNFISRVLLSLLLAASFAGCMSATTVGKAAIPGEGHSKGPRVYSSDYSQVFNRSKDAVLALDWSLVFSDESSGSISAKTPLNMWTWGDSVSIQITRIEGGNVRVDVSSGTSYQLVDWGKTSKNIEQFYRKLDELVGR